MSAADGRRLVVLALLGALVAAVTWLVARTPTPDQAMSLSVVVDRGTEAMQAVDRVGKVLTALPITEEIELGRALAKEIESRFPVPGENDAEFVRRQSYVAAVVEVLVHEGGLRRPRIPYTARLLPSGVANAYALPGGHVYITTGLLDVLESEAELAAVLGHEIAHVDLKHCVERIQYEVLAREVGGWPLEVMVSIGSGLWSVGYADELEAEADRWGVIYGERAGYHPEGGWLAISRLDSIRPGGTAGRGRVDLEVAGMIRDALGDYFDTHPPASERQANFERVWREQRFDLEGTAYYLGRKNRDILVPKSIRAFPEELVAGRIIFKNSTDRHDEPRRR